MRLQCWGPKDESHPVAMRRLGVIWEPVELQYSSMDGLTQRNVFRHGGENVAEVLEGAIELSPRNVVLGCVVPEKRPAAYPNFSCDGVHRRCFEPLSREQAKRRLLDRRM